MKSFRFWLTTGVLLFSSVISAYADPITGKVVGPDGKPVSGATIYVSVFPSTARFGKQNTTKLTSDAAGAFSLDIPPIPDPNKKNPPVARVLIAAPGFGMTQTFLTLRPIDSNTVRLEKGVSLRGKVVDTAGKPVVGVEVRLRSVYTGGSRGNGASYLWIGEDGRSIPGLFGKTDAVGAWTLTGIPSTAVQASVALVDAKYVQIASDISIGAAADANKSIIARPAAVVVGRVVGADGKPRAGVAVSARQENYGAGMASAVTAADGSYRLSGLPTGVVAVSVDSARAVADSAQQEVVAPLRQVVVTEGKETTAPNMVLTLGGVVEGIVSDAVDGKPVPNAQIIVEDSFEYSRATGGSISGANGKFLLRLPPGTYRLSISWDPEGYLKATETGAENVAQVKIVDGGTTPVAFRLPRALTLSGIAKDAAGKPAPGVEITVMEQGNPPKATTDSEGRWTLKGIKPGSLRLVATNDYEVLSGNEVTLSMKNAAAPIALTVRPFKVAPVTGQVVTQNGKPVAGVMIQALTKMTMGGRSFWMDVQESRTDDRGRFTLPPVRPENPEVELKFNKQGYKTGSGGTLLRQGDQFIITDAVLRVLDRGRTLKGRVVDAAGKPAVNALVAAAGSEVSTGGTRTDALGGFTLSGVPDEGRLLAARGASFGTTSLSASTASVVVRLAPLNMSVSVPKGDRDRAISLLRGIRQRVAAAKRAEPGRDNPIGDGLAWRVAPLDFPLALQFAPKDERTPISSETFTGLVIQVARASPLRINEWAIPALTKIEDARMRSDAVYAIVMASPEGVDTKKATLRLYKEMQALPVSPDSYWAARRLTRLGVLAARLSLPDQAQTWLDQALAKGGEARSIAVEAAEGGLPLLRRILPRVEAKDRSDTYMRTIVRLSRISPRSALALLQDMEKEEALKGSQDDYNRSVAMLAVIRTLASQDPVAVADLAGRVPYRDFQSAAWALAARGQSTPAKASTLYERAVNSGMTANSADLLARVASLAYETDPALGKTLFARAKRKLDEIPVDNETHRLSTAMRFAHYYKPIAAGESRLLLEAAATRFQSADMIKEDKFGNTRALLALALCPFSIERALQISETLPERQEGYDYDIRNDVQAKIACWLLTDKANRHALPLESYDQYGFEPRDY